MIYFIRYGDDGSPVKIGFTQDLKRRLWQLQNAHWLPLRILRAEEGGKPIEKWLHRRYRAKRLRGEWFAFDPEMLTVSMETGAAELTQWAADMYSRRQRGEAWSSIAATYDVRVPVAKDIGRDHPHEPHDRVLWGANYQRGPRQPNGRYVTFHNPNILDAPQHAQVNSAATLGILPHFIKPQDSTAGSRT